MSFLDAISSPCAMLSRVPALSEAQVIWLEVAQPLGISARSLSHCRRRALFALRLCRGAAP
eukprot:618759-Pleurochrysis_carterae.AAC.1